jgi:protein TonB
LIEDFTAAAPAALHAERGDVLVNLPFDFRDPSRATPPLEVVDPAWVAQVDPSAAPALFPESAAKAGYKTGIATVECEVTHTGALTGCSVVRENPPGYGFGKSALAVASVMVMNPWTQQGTPVDGARVRLPVTIDLPQDGATPPGASTTAKP